MTVMICYNSEKTLNKRTVIWKKDTKSKQIYGKYSIMKLFKNLKNLNGIMLFRKSL